MGYFSCVLSPKLPVCLDCFRMLLEEYELTAQLLLDLGCPLLNVSDTVSAAASWLQGISKSEDRGKFLEWIINHILGQKTCTETGIESLGLFSKQAEIKAFLEGRMREEREKKVWANLFSILHTHSKPDSSRYEILADLNHRSDFIDAIAENVSFSDEMNKPIPVLNYQMEKEVKKSKSSNPSRSKSSALQILRKVKDGKENLEKSSNSKDDQAAPGVSSDSTSLDLLSGLERFAEGSGKLTACTKEFETKYNSELKPVLKNKTTFTALNSHQVSDFAANISDLRGFLDGASSTIDNINTINNILTTTQINNK